MKPITNIEQYRNELRMNPIKLLDECMEFIIYEVNNCGRFNFYNNSYHDMINVDSIRTAVMTATNKMKYLCGCDSDDIIGKLSDKIILGLESVLHEFNEDASIYLVYAEVAFCVIRDAYNIVLSEIY